MVKVKNGTLAIKKLSPLSFNQIYQTITDIINTKDI